MKVWVNTITNNEENFLWFAVMSVIKYVDKILVYDTGSTDKSVEIIKIIQELYNDKIIFKEVGRVSKDKFPKLRQKMLEESKSDWILVLDGDEIWWEDSIRKLTEEIEKKGKKIEGIVVPFVVPVGDIYHLQEDKAGQYRYLGLKGHYSLRAINKRIPGLHIDWPYGKETYLDEDNKPIQERDGIIFLDAPYLHVTHLKRSNSKREYNKFKYELGERVSREFKFPEILYKDYPQIITSPWAKIPQHIYLLASLLTPLRKIKRRLK